MRPVFVGIQVDHPLFYRANGVPFETEIFRNPQLYCLRPATNARDYGIGPLETNLRTADRSRPSASTENAI